MATLLETLTNIEKGDLEQVYLLTGTEYFFIEQFTQAIERQFAQDDTGEIINYNLREISIQDVIADAETLPFFTEKKIIFAEYPYFLTNKNENIQINHDVKSLETYVENPAPFTHLILVAPYESLDGRKQITKHVRKFSCEVSCQPLKGKELKKWVSKLVEPFNIRISDDARYILETEYGSNLSMLQKEMEKLAHYVGDGGTITTNVLQEAMSASLELSAFDLVNQVLNQNFATAIRIYKQLEKRKEDPVRLVALLATQFRLIYQVKLLRKRGYALKQIEKEINAHPYVIKLAFERSNKYDEAFLSNILKAFAEADTLIKQGKMQKEIALEMLLYQIAVK